jgi:hypothetical protein
MVCVAVAVLPAASVAVQVTVVVPSGKLAGASFVTVTVVQLSVATGLPKLAITASHNPLALTVMFAGATIVGFVLSLTVTVCVVVAVFPALSITVHVTVVVPIEKVDGASLVTEATEQLSKVIGVPKLTLKAVHALVAETITSIGAVITGSSLSITVTVCVAVAVFPEPSVTVHVTVVVPIGKVAAPLFTTEATEQLSEVVGVPSKTPVATHDPASTLTLTLAGAVIVGF